MSNELGRAVGGGRGGGGGQDARGTGGGWVGHEERCVFEGFSLRRRAEREAGRMPAVRGVVGGLREGGGLRDVDFRI
jgi:hypothetical protein